MKAIYQSPKTDIVTVSLQHMIAASKLGNPEDGFNLDEAPGTEETSGNLGRRRRRDVWDDEEEEEW